MKVKEILASEGFAEDLLAMAKQKNSNAKIHDPEQAKKDDKTRSRLED